MKKKTLLFVAVLFAGAFAIQAAPSAEKARTPAEWVEVVEAQAAKEQKNIDPEFERLRLGAAICMGHYNARTDHQKYSHSPKNLSAVEAFKQFMAGPGLGLIEKWRVGEAFSPDEKKYRYIIQGAVFYRGLLKDRDIKNRLYQPEFNAQAVAKFKDYAAKVDREADAVLRKGYRGELLTDADVETLRLYKIRQFVKGGDRFVPYDLGYHPLDGSGQKLSGAMKTELHRRFLGTQAPDIKSPWLETVLEREGFSDQFDYEYSVTWSYRMGGVLEFLWPLSGYTMDAAAGKQICVRNKEYSDSRPGEKAGDDFRLSEVIGKKPIVLIANDPSDSAFSHWPYTEVLCQAYKDQFDFYFVAVSIWDQTMGNPNYFNPAPSGERGLRNGHYYSMDDRARRAKNRYIETPHATFPCVLDDLVQTGRNLYYVGGGQNHFVIIDVDGKVAARGQSNMHLQTQWMTDLERAMNTAIDSRGKAVELPSNPDDTFCSYSRVPIPERTLLTVGGTVQSIDKAQQIFTLSARVGKETKEYTATIGGQTRMDREGAVIDLSDVKVGDSCTVVFPDESYYAESTVKMLKMGHRHAEKIEITGTNGVGVCQVRSPMSQFPYNRAIFSLKSDTGNGQITPILIRVGTGYVDNNVWFFGTVDSVSADGREISVKQSLADKDEMKGYSFWKEAKDRCALDAATRGKMDMIEWWHGKPEKERMYTFALDDATGVFLNGEFDGITHKNLKVGDFVAIEMNTVQAREKVIRPNAVRSVRKK